MINFPAVILVLTFLIADAPSAPASAHVTDVHRDSCVLHWQQPTTDGGSSVTGYVIERRSGFGGSWSKVATAPSSDNSYRFYDLIENTTYEFQVRAENRIGLSKPVVSTPVVARAPWSKPAAPSAPVASDVTKRSCTLTWKPPTDDGGDDVRYYIIEYRVIGALRYTRANDGDRTTQCHFKVTGLQTDEEYEFRVAADNRAGLGAFSELSRPVRTQQPESKRLHP